MSKLTVKTNGHYNHMFYGYELPDKVKKDFDYIEDIDSANFIKYKGHYYSVGDLMRCTGELADMGWQGYESGSAFSGVVFKFDEYDQDRVCCGTYFC